MAWVAVDEDDSIWIFDMKPKRRKEIEDGEVVYEGWQEQSKVYQQITELSIEQLIGRKLTWEDEPVELK